MRLAAVAALALATACDGSASAPQVHPGSAAQGPTAAAATAAPVPSKSTGLVEGSSVRPHHEEQVVECPAKVPDSAEDEARVNAYLDEANKQIEQGSYGAAWTCADRAADLAPTSVEAHHLRGAALAALGRDSE